MAKRGSPEHNKKLIEQTKAKRWKKGQSGNPHGRPKRLPSLDVILAHVFGVNEGQPDEKSKLTEIMEAMYKAGKRGNVPAANLVLERMAGKVAQKVNMQVGVSKEDVGKLFPFAPPDDETK